MFAGVSRILTKVAAGVVAISLAAVVLLPGERHASAQAGGHVDPKKLEVIRDRMEKGQALFAAGDYAGAAQVFEAAHAEQPYAAFLFNAGVCYQKLGKLDVAVAKFEGYLSLAPDAADADKVRERIAALKASMGAPPVVPAIPDAGATDAAADAGAESAEAGVPTPLAEDTAESMKSLALIETDPPGAPVKLYFRQSATAAAFRAGGANAGWKEVVATRSPANLTLEIGQYHVVVEPYRDFRACDAPIEVKRAKFFHFRANLSQGQFMGFLRVSSNVQGAYVFIDDDRKQHPPWGTTPHGELISNGAHTLLVEAPGFDSLHRKLELGHGEQKEIEVQLARQSSGILRVQGTAPELRVQVDEKSVGAWRSGEAPLDVELDAGSHKLTIKAPGYKSYEGMVTIPKGQVLPLNAEMVPTYPRGTAWTQAIIGAVFIGAGTYLGIKSNQLHSDLEADRRAGVLEEDDERIKRGQIYAIGADAGFVLGGVLAGFATYNFIKDPYPDSKATVGKPVELDDPRKARPTAWLRARRRVRVARPGPAPAPFRLQAGPSGISLGGSF
jgi:hypothetical protein